MTEEEEEEQHLNLTKEKVSKEQESCFDMMREYTRMSPKELGNCGHKTVEEAVMSTLRSSIRRIDDLWKTHIKKFPD